VRAETNPVSRALRSLEYCTMGEVQKLSDCERYSPSSSFFELRKGDVFISFDAWRIEKFKQINFCRI
jgi:hypothetical protein